MSIGLNILRIKKNKFIFFTRLSGMPRTFEYNADKYAFKRLGFYYDYH